MSPNVITYVDLFSGCGGFSLGLKMAGLQCVQAIEIDSNAAKTYAMNLKLSPLVEDIRELEVQKFEKADLVVGGFPCQPFSLSGLQRGYFGDDGDLFSECLRALKATEANYFVFENVAGFVRLNGGLFLRIALRQLRKLGFNVDWQIINSVDFGVPQKRERLLMIGNNLGLKNSFPKKTKKGLSVKEAIDDIRFDRNLKNNDPMKHTDRIVKRFAATKQGETTRDAMDRDSTLGDAKITKQCYRRLIESEPAPTVVANFVTTTLHYEEHRNLTAREAARIQSFPDDFEFFGFKTRMSWESGLSQFEQIGNAVPPLLAKSIGEAIKSMKSNPITQVGLNAKEDLFDDEEYDERLVEELVAKYAKNDIEVKVKRRGRRSKYQDFYEQMENALQGDILSIPENADDAFYLFFPAAMRRRKIKFKLLDDKRKVKIA